MQIRQQIDREQSNRQLRRLHDSFDIDNRRESPASLPDPAQSEKQVLIERSRVADDLIIRAARNGVD